MIGDKMNYKMVRKLQEQAGSYFIVVPKVWVEAQGLQQSDLLTVQFDDSTVTIIPVKKAAA